ncbi:MAG: RNA 2',3'-cyclic phosphodiesterase, partial [Eubacterium sp.]|nr:RNA 2',3'-cyclic phosphodiesterase [Eubacterium sp.]
MRLFIAIDLTEKMKKDVTVVLHSLKKAGVNGNYVPVKNLHLTLAFIGETDRVDEIRQIMDSVPAEPARLSFSEFGQFGNTFWIGIKGNQKLKKYANDLRLALKKAGFEIDDKKFTPHITLIRKANGKRPADLT